jgi:hypothetical protein
MYSVVGCPDCESVWIVESEPATTTCPRCATRHRFDGLRKLARADDKLAAREARSMIMADRMDEGDNADPDSFAEMDRDIEARRSPPTSPSPSGSPTSDESVIKSAIRTLDPATESGIVSFAGDHDVPEKAARDILERLVRAGEATESAGRYRLL